MRNSLTMVFKTSRLLLQEERKKDMHFGDMKSLFFGFLENGLPRTGFMYNRGLMSPILSPNLNLAQEEHLPLSTPSVPVVSSL